MTSVTLVLTNACNQDCSYCYQKKDSLNMDFNTAKKSIDYFCKAGNGKSIINFYGGEPFLQYELMKKIIPYGKKRFRKHGNQLRFSVTTNGSLLDQDHLTYCYQNDVDIYLSIDGNKKAHERGRGKDSFISIEKTLSVYKEFPDFPLKVQMVITPDNVKHLLKSVRYLVSTGVSDLSLNFCYDQKWHKKEIKILHNQYSKTYNFLVKHNSEGGKIQFKEIKKPDPLKPLFRCEAGQDRFAITPDGFIYGCSMHIPWSKRAFDLGSSHHLSDLCLGHVSEQSGTEFKKRLNELSKDRRLFGQYFYQTSKKKCLECDYFNQCDLCPVYAMIFNQEKFLIPDWICDIKKIECQARPN